ncbi:AMMECR1 family protein [Bifidobacterium sp. DSM 109958]|uniref:AMMECR1 family protein n=1 Tax=Bifidobacterium moraviense TaxID=2675323 RepID=A0A7Y0F251_9BIFI|nr:AmmeMemoRadiSam system protein B [Bifidobacterium sp. DSM 109958]NMN00665.1 AMMECR1 family protein [Bifidobacterium sp. DSM 109958]
MGNEQAGNGRFRRVRPPAVAGAFYPADPREATAMLDEQLAYARRLLRDRDRGTGASGGAGEPARANLRPWPKAVIVPHAGWVYSGTAAALAYALLEAGRGTVRRVVLVGPTHRVAVRGVAMSTADAWRTPLGTLAVDVEAERRVLDAGSTRLIVNDPTHAREHAVEVQLPFVQRTLGGDVSIVPLNAGDATPKEVGDVLRALWGGPETVIVISSDLSHYHPEREARAIDDETIRRVGAFDFPITPDRACGAYPINGLLDVIARSIGAVDGDTAGGDAAGVDAADGASATVDLEFLGCSTSGDDGVVALAGEDRPAMRDPDERVVGYAAWALWEHDADTDPGTDLGTSPRPGTDSDADAATVLLGVARASLAERLGIAADGPSAAELIAAHPWLDRLGASFVTLTEGGRLRGCIGSIIAHQSLGRDVAEHAVDAAMRDPRFRPVSAQEYPLLRMEVSVLGVPELMEHVPSRAALEAALRPGMDGLIIEDAHGHAATFLPQVWDELPNPHAFVGHLLAKAGLPADLDWDDGRIIARRYTVHAYRE